MYRALVGMWPSRLTLTLRQRRHVRRVLVIMDSFASSAAPRSTRTFSFPNHHLSLFFFTTKTAHDVMSQRRATSKPSENGKDVMDQAKIDALQQYQDTEGHFSLVRSVKSSMAVLSTTFSTTTRSNPWFSVSQKFPSGRPRHDHEWCLRLLLHLHVSEIPPDERRQLPVVRIDIPRRGSHVRLYGR